jgi:3-hydroxyisobutyrate dehydrogenase-like beta-hydroxyacid dehydrogenase
MTAEKPLNSAVGVIGLGIIGSRVVSNLRRAGHQVWLWNRTVRPEPNFLSSPAEVAEASRFIQIFVSNGEALLSVIRNMAPALTPAHVVINHATVSPAETLEVAQIVKDRQAAFLDAPFTGSRDAAGRGELVYYIGGDEEVLKTARPVLAVGAKQILHIGAIGHASAIKVATNVISATQIAALSEALALLDRHEVDLSKLSLALENNTARSGVIEMKLPGILAGDFDPRFSLKNMFKDIQIALAMAEDKDVELPTASAFAGMAMAGLQRGWGEEDFSVISRFYGYTGRIPKSPEPAPEAAEIPPDSAPSPTPRRLSNLWGLLGRKK